MMRSLLLVLALWMAQDQPPRWQLAGAFARRDSAAVRRLLAPDVMVWPPAPDTARRGSAAIGYLQGLALTTRVSRSDLRPDTVAMDGPYLAEQGVWTLTSGRTRVRAPYDLRWRQVEGRWRVSFFKWGLFQ
ncbi:MAG TPA: nuclear transport factor 2 family protein [Gemmatimonadales bacterium]|jgi:hypothetical protein